MVADAEELVADEPDVPVLKLVTQQSPREEQQDESTSGGWPSWPGRFVRLQGSTDPIGLIAGQDGS